MGTAEAKTKIEKKTVLSVLNIGARLLVICLVVAAVGSLVNEVTKKRYAELQEQEKANAMAAIFGVSSVTVTELSDPHIERNNCYAVQQGDELLGFCVQVVTAGFGGDMTLMVGFNSDLAVVGVQILSHSETPGLGARVNDAGYLSQYGGKTGDLVLGEDIDAISGATISSKAVLAGVNEAQKSLRLHVVKEGDAQ